MNFQIDWAPDLFLGGGAMHNKIFESFRKFSQYEPISADVVGVFVWNIENVFEIPLKLFFIKFAVACDDDENNDDVAVDEVAAIVVVVVIGLLTIGVVYCVLNDVEYDAEYDAVYGAEYGTIYGVVNDVASVNGGSTIVGFCNGLSVS